MRSSVGLRRNHIVRSLLWDADYTTVSDRLGFTGTAGVMTVSLLPDDPHDRALVAGVRPPGWVNPTPAPRYNLVVVGAGTAGLVCAAGAAGLGARVALVERELMGGDCLNFGCVPSKALLRAARAYSDIGRTADYGITVPRDCGIN